MKDIRAMIRLAAMGMALVPVGSGRAQPPAAENTAPAPVVVQDATEHLPASRQFQYYTTPLNAPPGGTSYDFFYGQGLADTANSLNWRALVLNDVGNGARLEPADGSLATQLGIPPGQGLVVTALTPDSPAAEVGLARNDLLLTLGDKPLARPDDVAKQLKAAGDKPVRLRLLRSGKPLTIEIKPIYNVTFGPVAKESRDFYIGVPVEAPDEALRAHLDLPAGQGLVVKSVEPDSPAAKAGLKPFDILLSFGDKPLDDAKALVEQIRASDGKTVTLKVLRSGKRTEVPITPERRKGPAEFRWSNNDRFTYRVVRAPLVDTLTTNRPVERPLGLWVAEASRRQVPSATAPLDKRLDDLIKEVKELHQAVEQLQKSIKAKEGSEQGEK